MVQRLPADEAIPRQVLHHHLLLLGCLLDRLQPLGHDHLQLLLPVQDDIVQSLKDLLCGLHNILRLILLEAAGVRPAPFLHGVFIRIDSEVGSWLLALLVY